MTRRPLPRALSLCLLVLGFSLLGACATQRNTVPTGTSEPDKYLFDKGQEALAKKRWLTSREYFRQIVDGYPQSLYRADAKLSVGESFLGENSAASYVQAETEFREFLTFYPTHPKADVAQYKLGMCHFLQMAQPERDQSETRAALKEFEVFLERFPNSALLKEVTAKKRETRDRLSESEYRVGLFYFRSRWYPGAVDRLRAVLASDPEFTRRDAVYFYLAESLVAGQRAAEALPVYERLVNEFQQSQFLEATQKRITELKNAPPPLPPGQPPPKTS